MEGLGRLVGELAADDTEGWNDGLPPRLLRAVNDHNVVRYNGVFYGIPQSAGPLDLSRDDLSGLSGIVSGHSFAEVVGELSRR